jgi:hypothetical protein
MDSEYDPYDVVPESFCDDWVKETIPAALEAAERAKSSTDPADRPRCPECGSYQVLAKVEDFDVAQKNHTRFKCEHSICRAHFDEPAAKSRIFPRDERAKPFDWVSDGDLLEADKRTRLSERNDEPAEGRPEACQRTLKVAD